MTPAQHDPHDTRAGPGDAGYADRPDPRPQSPDERRRGRSATRLFIWMLVVGVVVAVALNLSVVL